MTVNEFKRLEGENEKSFLWRIGEAKTSGVLDASWDEIAKVINQEFYDEAEYKNEGMYRRPYMAAKTFYEDVFARVDGRDYDDQRVELMKERQKLRDERTQYNKYIRDEARFEQQLEEIGRQIQTSGANRYMPIERTVVATKESEMLVLLSDWHIGLEYNNEFGEYNTQIAKERLGVLLKQIRKYDEIHQCRVCNVAVLGDLISGNIHPSIMIANRENVIEQVMTASEILTDFLYELCREFPEVSFVSVAGNHSRIEKNKDKSVKNERLDDFVGWHVKSALKHIENFKPRMCVDNTVAELGICGQLYYFVHGDYDEITQAGVSKLAFMLGDIPYAVCTGHKHFPLFTQVNGVAVLQNGSLCGSGDDHTVEHRLSGAAYQVVAICDSDGIECYYPVRLDV